MTQSALHSISSPSSLTASFSQLKRKKKKRLHVHGVDRVSLANFAEFLSQNISSLSDQIAKGSYKPNDLRAFLIPKSDGVSYRVIGIPSTADRVLQLSLLGFLDNSPFKFNSKNNYGFVKQGGVKKALEKAQVLRAKNSWAVKIDIEAFFDTIPRNLLKEKIRKRIRYRSLHDLMCNYVDCELKFDARDSQHEAKISITEGQGVRQGMPLSPFFANLFLDDFDVALESKGLKFIRYADDIICFGRDEYAVQAIPAIVSEELSSIGLSLKESKTKYASGSEPIEFLGLDSVLVNGNYTTIVSEEKIDAMISEIMQYSDYEYCKDRILRLPSVYRRLQGMVDGYHGFFESCANADQAAMQLDHAAQECVRKLLGSVLEVDVAGLSNQKITFLGL